MKNASIKILSGSVLSLLLSQAWAGTITDIKVSSLSADQKVVKIQFKDDVAIPKDSITNQPPQLSLDFSGTSLKVPQNVLRFNDPLLRAINASANASNSRLVLSLHDQAQYQVIKKGDSVLVYLKSAEGEKAADKKAAKPAVAAAAVANKKQDSRYQPVRLKIDSSPVKTAVPKKALQNAKVDVRFSKGLQNSGEIQLNLPENHPTPKIERNGNSLILTFQDMPLAAADQRNFEVSEFSTPVKKIALRRLGNNTQVKIFNGAGWDYKVADKGGRYVVSVMQQANLFETLDDKPKAKTFKGGKVTLDFQDVDVRTVLQILAKESGVNIVASDTVGGKMTLNLKDVPWDQALDLVMQARNLDMRRQGNIINIAPRSELLAQDRQIMQGQKEQAEMGPLVSRTFQLKYKSVEDFKTMLDSVDDNGGNGDSNSNGMLSSRGSIMIDAGTNTLIVTDNQGIINKFEKLIMQLDVPVRQVMIEARIVEASENFARDLGVRFGGGLKKGFNTIGGFNSPSNSFGDGIGVVKDNTRSWVPNVSLPISAPTSGISFIHSRATGAILLELSAMQAEGEGKIVSSPRVLTQDRQEASLEEGVDVPYQEATSSGATSTTFRKAVTGLTVTPQITPDGNVIMKLKINKDSVDERFNDGRMNVKRVETTAMVENGGTMVVGGIYVEENADGESKVPLLGDIPVLGNLFKSQTKKRNRRELLIFITPRVMDTMNSNNLYY